jgi:hypothetical protein
VSSSLDESKDSATTKSANPATNKAKGQISETDELTCITLLKAMELEEYNGGVEVEELEGEMVDQETLNLPEEWIYNMTQTDGGSSQKTDHEYAEIVKEDIQLGDEIQNDQPQIEKESEVEGPSKEQDQLPPAKAKRKKKVWGPIQPKRRSKRQSQDGVPVFEKAQALKMKYNLEVPKGITYKACHLTSKNLSDLASMIGIQLEESLDKVSSCVDSILEDNDRRKEHFSVGCSFAECSRNTEVVKHYSIVTRSKVAQEVQNVTVGNISDLVKGVGKHTTGGSLNEEEKDSDILVEEPSTPVAGNLDTDKYDQLADLVEEAWSKRDSKKKNKKKRK